MTAIPAIFDGKAFVPKEPVRLPAQAEVLVLAEQTDRAAMEQLDAAVRAYYCEISGGDAQDKDWTKAVSQDLRRAWDED